MVLNLAFYIVCILLCSLHARVTNTEATFRPNALHLTYYAHETRLGPNATVLAAASTGQGNMMEMGWGTFLVLDNALKEGDTTDNKVLGSITGTAMVTTIGGAAKGGMQVNTQHIFNAASMYNASSLLVIGTISTPTPPYECIIPGGTGFFRGYSGYGILTPLVAATNPPLYVYQWDIYISYKKKRSSK